MSEDASSPGPGPDIAESPVPRLVAWPPPGLERLRGDLWEVVDRLAVGGIFTLPLLATQTLPQDPWRLGIYGDAWWIVLVTSIAGLSFMLAGYFQLLRLLWRWRVAAGRGYRARTVALVLADRPGDTGYLVQGDRAYSLIDEGMRRALLNGRLAQVGLLVAAGLWLTGSFIVGVLMTARGMVGEGGLALWTLLPLALVVAAVVMLRGWQNGIILKARKAWHTKPWTEDLARDEIRDWHAAVASRPGAVDVPEGTTTGLTLVVSNPPHREVDDAEAARCFGLTPAESRLKANFSAPEIWLALPERKAAKRASEPLRKAGLNVAVIAGSDLLSIPSQVPVKSFAFTDTDFVARFEDGEIELPYDSHITGVFCRPPTDVAEEDVKPQSRSAARSLRRSTGVLIDRVAGSPSVRSDGSVADARARMTILDLYVSRNGGLQRISIRQDATDFAGLDDLKGLGADANMATLVAECERRFTRLQIDRRQVNVRPRRRLIDGGGSNQEVRRLFSFGTLGLSQVLESISPDLKDISQFELGSRLAYLMGR